MTSGRVVLAATPIGNPGDASDRLRDVLATADIVAAEDTRRLRSLATALEVTIRGRVMSYFEHNEACLLYTSPSPRDGLLSRMPSSA